MTHEAPDDVRLCQVYRMAATRDQRRHTPGGGAGQAEGVGTEAGVVGTRPAPAAAPRHFRGCGPTAAPGFRCRPTASSTRVPRRCCAAVRPSGPLGQPGNIGPLTQRAMKASTSPEASSAAAVASSACRRRPGPPDPRCHRWRRSPPGGGSPDRCRWPRGAPPGPRGSNREDRTAPNRAAGDRVPHQVGRRGRSARTSSEPACPGRSMAIRVWSWASDLPEAAPQAPRLREAVQQHQGRAGAASFDMEGHAR